VPEGTTTDDHPRHCRRLAKARRLLQAGQPDDLKTSIAASREACELLRKNAPLPGATADRSKGQ
jgi:hypothetical protein